MKSVAVIVRTERKVAGPKWRRVVSTNLLQVPSPRLGPGSGLYFFEDVDNRNWLFLVPLQAELKAEDIRSMSPLNRIGCQFFRQHFLDPRAYRCVRGKVRGVFLRSMRDGFELTSRSHRAGC